MRNGVKLLLCGGAVAAAAVGGGLAVWTGRSSPAPTLAAPAALPPSSKPAAPVKADLPATQPRPTAPSFDVVRVSPRGETVIAGRASPGAEVVVKEGAAEIGKAKADSRGEFVVLPEKKLDPGSRSLSLEAKAVGESTAQRSSADVVMVVPERSKDVAGRPAEQPAAALALLVPRTGGAPARPLQVPGAAPAAKDRLGVDIVEYDAAGEVAIGGDAAPGAGVRVFLGETPLGESKAGADGRWAMMPKTPVAPGTYTLRVEQVRPDGSVSDRVSLPFQRAVVPRGTPVELMVVVQPGDNLWHIARETYGSGVRYAVIYAANQAQIANPDLIFPGQVFTLPAAN